MELKRKNLQYPCIRERSFNRTIVELKLILSLYHYDEIFAFNRTIVELKPSAEMIQAVKNYLAFNRTIVELKPPIDVSIIDSQTTFNRTIVELKLEPSPSTTSTEETFNRTIVELKLILTWHL